MAKIINFGSLNLDYVYAVEHFVRAGETLPSTDLQAFCGGKGLNQSIALARAGAEVIHAGFTGEKDGRPLLDILTENGVNTSLIEKRPCPSGHAIIQVDKNGQNCILLHGGANQTNSEEYVSRALSGFGAGDYLLMQNEVNLGAEIIKAAKDRGLAVILNPSPIDEKIHGFPLDLVDFLILNEVEAAALCGINSPSGGGQLGDALTAKFPNTSIVLTLGNQGSAYIDKAARTPVSQAIIEIKVADTTAAGDTFTGYFFAGIMSGAPPADALKTATAAAALAVSQNGAAVSIPTMAQVRSFLST
ncbi:MAG: ribokinase [Treponema sp.]|jgi:ribokinase|nr:ribokinase [Treponema sp.]